MKQLIASVLLIAPALAWVGAVQASTAKPAASASKAATAQKKTAAVKKTTVRKTSAPRKAAAAAAVGGSGAGVAVAALAPRALHAEEMKLADRVYTGRINCELGKHVNVTRDEKNPGHFFVSGQGFSYHMLPVGTSTGVVRLEDQRAGATWLQIANKSMLMNQKQGKRMADECMSPEQLQVAEAIKKNPPQSLLEAPKK